MSNVFEKICDRFSNSIALRIRSLSIFLHNIKVYLSEHVKSCSKKYKYCTSVSLTYDIYEIQVIYHKCNIFTISVSSASSSSSSPLWQGTKCCYVYKLSPYQCHHHHHYHLILFNKQSWCSMVNARDKLCSTYKSQQALTVGL